MLYCHVAQSEEEKKNENERAASPAGRVSTISGLRGSGVETFASLFFFFNQILFLFSSVSRRRISSAILSLLDTMTSSVVSTKGFCPVKEECRGLLFLFNKEKIWLITRTKLATLSPFQLFTSSAVRPQQTRDNWPM